MSCGLYVCQDNPMIAASPDGLMKDAIIEIKCPTKAKTKDSYLKNGVITEKCNAQVQLLMYATGVKNAIFVLLTATLKKQKMWTLF